MEDQHGVKKVSRKYWDIATLVLIIIAISGFSGYKYNKLNKKNTGNENKIAELEKNLFDTKESLALARVENQNLQSKLVQEQNINNGFATQIGQISSNVGTLIKLSQTDEELLQKYSKVYFLNENYKPSNLSNIDSRYLSDPKKTLQIHTNVLPFLTRLIDAAATNNIQLQVLSAFRSFDTQSTLKQSYRFVYGSGANSFSADQGYSEHQLGTTLDFTTAAVGPGLTGFEKDPAFGWLVNNAYKYGFILSYPKQNDYYEFEPWHWRFVGVALATKIHSENTLFYYLDQREIDKFLVNIFD